MGTDKAVEVIWPTVQVDIQRLEVVVEDTSEGLESVTVGLAATIKTMHKWADHQGLWSECPVGVCVALLHWLKETQALLDNLKALKKEAE